MHSHYRWIISFLIFPMAFGYNPVTDTLKKSVDIDLLYGTSVYYGGCEAPRQDMTFQEIHVGTREKMSERCTAHLDAGIVPMQVKPIQSYRGKNSFSWYVLGGADFDWEYAGLGFNFPLFDPYIRLGSKEIVYADLGLAHRFPLSSSGLLTLGVGSGFGSDYFNLWIGKGSGGPGPMVAGDYGGYSIAGDYRVDDNLSLRFGGLQGDDNSRSFWLGMRFDLR